MPLVGLCQFISLLQKSAQYVFIWITCQVISLPNSGTLSLCCMWKLQKKKQFGIAVFGIYVRIQ